MTTFFVVRPVWCPNCVTSALPVEQKKMSENKAKTCVHLFSGGKGNTVGREEQVRTLKLAANQSYVHFVFTVTQKKNGITKKSKLSHYWLLIICDHTNTAVTYSTWSWLDSTLKSELVYFRMSSHRIVNAHTCFSQHMRPLARTSDSYCLVL